MNPLTRFWQRLTEYLTTSENVLSRTVRTVRRRFAGTFARPTHDWARADYAWWQRAYYCRVRGLELSGLFIKPLCNKIAAWVLGRPAQWKVDDERSQEALNTWWADVHPRVLLGFLGALIQGDGFVVVNPDGSVTVVPPDAVDPIVADDDYGQITGWRVMLVLSHPTDSGARMVVIDEYYADRRIQRIEINGAIREETTYPNLFGRIPLIHIPNRPMAGETFGHAEAEALVEVLHRYGVVLEAAVEGNELQGRPTPVATFESVADLDKFWATYGETQTQTLPDGTTQTVPTLSIDLSQLLTLSAGTFKYEAPGSFTEDTERLLGLMFYLILEHTEIPEFVFGNAIASSKASAETQMPVFEAFVEQRREEIGGWLTELAQVALSYLSLVEPGINGDLQPVLQWKPLTQDGRLTLDTVIWAYTEGLLDERTALMLAPLDVEDIDQVLDAARVERVAQPTPDGNTPPPEDMDQALADEIDALEI